VPALSDAFSFQALRRFPDLEADNLVAADATDRLALTEASTAIQASPPGRVAVVGDRYGAMTLGAMALHGARDVRVHQDSLTGEQALAHNAIRAGLTQGFRPLPLTHELFTGASVVIGQLPKSLEALREITQLAAAHAAHDVTVFLGGRVKHMTHAMNDVMGESFTDVQASLAHQKSRVLAASGPGQRAGPAPRGTRCDSIISTWTCGSARTAPRLRGPGSTSVRGSCWSFSTRWSRLPGRQWTSAVAPVSSPLRWPGLTRS